jgi:hypothetical protein
MKVKNEKYLSFFLAFWLIFYGSACSLSGGSKNIKKRKEGEGEKMKIVLSWILTS